MWRNRKVSGDFRILQMFLCFSVCCVLQHPLLAVDRFGGTKSEWNGFERFDLEVGGRPLMVICPKSAAVGIPWVWHGEFFGHKPAPDIALLHLGFHVVYASIPNMLGSPDAVAHWDKVYDYLTKYHHFSPKAGLVGLSRGGLYCYNWAIANPDKVACIYGDAPVCDFRSWPGGFGEGPGSPGDWHLVLKLWKFGDNASARRFEGNPVDNLMPLAQAGVPLLHVFGDADEIVPWQENTGLVTQRYRQLGGSIEIIRKQGGKHHPHGLEDPTPIVNFLHRNCSPPTAELNYDETTSTRQANEGGIIVHRLLSPFQGEATQLRVLLPGILYEDSSRTAAKPVKPKSSVLFVLPVEKQHQSRWGDGLAEIQRTNLHNRFQLVCVEPGFAQLPWYADHPSEKAIRQELYLLSSVLPLLRWLYPEARHDRDGRLLVGFSKSGFGAWSLMLRHPQIFGKAAAWDAPLSLAEPGKYGSGEIFGNLENFQKYEIGRLLRLNQALLKPDSESSLVTPGPRLIHAGFDTFRADHQATEKLLNELEIPHRYHDGPKRSHHWSSGWLEQLVQDLAE